MASASRPSVDSNRELIFWLGFGVFSIVVLILVGVLYVVMTVSSINASAPRTVMERRLRTVKAALAQNPSNDELWGDYISALSATKQFGAAKRAIADADKALKVRKAQVAVEEARLAFLQGDTSEAVTLADAAIALGKKEHDARVKELQIQGVLQEPPPGARLEAMVLKGEILESAKEWKGVVKAYTAALALDPTMADVLLSRGEAFVELGDMSAAKADFERALGFIPGWEPARAALRKLGR